ncbi:MAG: DUF5606 family protein [Luteibaculaceae bacterium]
MQLTGVISITGKPGLYKVVAQARQGLIVESLVDKKRTAISANHRVSSLEDISIFTYGEDVPLKEVYAKIYAFEEGKNSIDSKSDPKDLAAHLEKIFPEYDKERVKNGDIKKLFAWYNLLNDNGLLSPTEEPAEAEAAAEPAEKPEAKAAAEETAPKKKKAAKAEKSE